MKHTATTDTIQNRRMPSPRLTYDDLTTAAREHLKANGWTYRAAATRLGRDLSHLSHVLNGHRQSRSLLERILRLPKAPRSKKQPA